MHWLDLPLHQLPGVYSMHVMAHDARGEKAIVFILLKGERRADVAKWARHFGSDVVEDEPRPDDVGGWERLVTTAFDVPGFRVTVRTIIPTKAPARPSEAQAPVEKFPWRVHAHPADGQPRLVNAFTAHKSAASFVERERDQHGPLVITFAGTPETETETNPMGELS